MRLDGWMDGLSVSLCAGWLMDGLLSPGGDEDDKKTAAIENDEAHPDRRDQPDQA